MFTSHSKAPNDRQVNSVNDHFGRHFVSQLPDTSCVFIHVGIQYRYDHITAWDCWQCVNVRQHAPNKKSITWFLTKQKVSHAVYLTTGDSQEFGAGVVGWVGNRTCSRSLPIRSPFLLLFHYPSPPPPPSAKLKQNCIN